MRTTRPGGRHAARDAVLMRLLALALLPFSVLLAACGDDNEPAARSTVPGPATAAATTTPGLEGDVRVFAAASLTDAFTGLGEAFEAEHDGVDITFNFASSSALATQINEAAPADVFAPADNAQMKVVTDAGNAADPAQFATNSPVVVVPAGETTVRSFEDLANAGVALVLAGPDVPIGRYARQILESASTADAISPDFAKLVLGNLRSEEANVRAVLAKVQLGEADAGIVYQTDAAVAADEVDVIEIPPRYNVVATYPIAVTTESENPDAAAAFVDFVLSDEGQAILAEFGFGPAEGE